MAKAKKSDLKADNEVIKWLIGNNKISTNYETKTTLLKNGEVGFLGKRWGKNLTPKSQANKIDGKLDQIKVSKSVYLIENGGKKFVISKFTYPKGIYNGKIMADSYKNQKELHKKGLNMAQPIVYFSEDSYKQNDNNIEFQIFEFVEGKHLKSLNQKQSAALGQEMAKMHKFLAISKDNEEIIEKFAQSKRRYNLYAQRQINQSTQKLEEIDEEKSDKNDLKEVKESIEQFNKSLKIVETKNHLPLGWNHGGLDYHNVFYNQKEEKFTIIDFDHLHIDEFTKDLTEIIIEFFSNFDEALETNDKAFKFDKALCKTFLENYNKIRILSEEELEAIPQKTNNICARLLIACNPLRKNIDLKKGKKIVDEITKSLIEVTKEIIKKEIKEEKQDNEEIKEIHASYLDGPNDRILRTIKKIPGQTWAEQLLSKERTANKDITPFKK